MRFHLTAPYQPAGDQPKAIQSLTQGLQEGQKAHTLLGVTGSGKTFTVANVIQQVARPTLVVSHNKTLAAQLYTEFKTFFPENAVEYFVSYYDYYQPEAYIPSTGVYIEKELAINEEIEKMRLRTVSTLLSGRRDVLVVASVSCIYGLSNPAEFGKTVRHIKVGNSIDRDAFLLQLVELLYTRNEEKFARGNFRARGDTVDLFLAYGEAAYRFFFFGDEIEAIHEIDPKEGTMIRELSQATIYPANLFVTSKSDIEEAIVAIEEELNKQVRFFLKEGKKEEAERLEERTRLDIDMMREVGYCSGIENYSRFFDRRQSGQRPYCLFDYFPQDYLLIIDESHVTIPQIKGMWGGDHARKRHLIDHGFRIPSAMDNRPLHLGEFETLIHQVIYVSATPAPYELQGSEGLIVEQIIRPTGLLDPEIEVVPTKHQIDHLLEAIHQRIALDQRILITTLTKKMAEKLQKHLEHHQIHSAYLHSEVKTLDRIHILEKLRAGTIDVLVGVNLLREGLDLPEVSLLAIMDADKEGFLRNTSSLIQTIGRVARHTEGKVYMYADKVTPSMEQAIHETQRRREKQMHYNQRHHITPSPIVKKETSFAGKKTQKRREYPTPEEEPLPQAAEPTPTYTTQATQRQKITALEKQMKKAAQEMDFLKAHKLKEALDQLQAD